MTDLIILSVGMALAGGFFAHAAEDWFIHPDAQYAARGLTFALWFLSLCSAALAIWKAASA